VPTTRVERLLAADPETVWAVAADPHHQPRWWPRVQRVEDVDADAFTQVLGTAKGKGVRADFRVLEAEAPVRLRWMQELAGSPFERLLAEAITTFELTPEGSGSTRVAIELHQRLLGWSRLAPWQFRRAARRQLEAALAGLDEVVVGENGSAA
jgi:uncharacterized protein YndB with AHSA1/START domain